jgi:hypothetical protein
MFDIVQGIDITEDGVTYAAEKFGLNVISGDLLRHDLGNQVFDVVCMWDTIEHLKRPDMFIDKICKHTDRGALLAITTGDMGSLNARINGDRWRMIHPPTHIHYFSSSTMARLLDRYGFDIIYNRHCGFYRSVGLVATRLLALKTGTSKLYDLLQKIGLTKFDFYLNLYDIMYLMARKR